MTDKVRTTIEKYNMLPIGSTVIIGLSGGADSMSLAHLLLNLKKEYSLNLIAAHINHGIRGDEALRDENFVRDFCKKSNLPLKVLNTSIPDEAQKTGEGEEECGRRIRYEFFKSIDENALIATAHNLNDSIETFFINLSRGTALKGLLGIPPKRENIIRPLIECSRDEIEEYCSENQVKYIIDSTNLSNEYTRNKIRNLMLPQFSELNPSFNLAMQRCISALNEDNEALTILSSDLIEKSKTNNEFSIENFLNALPAIRKRALATLINENTGKMAEQVHIELVEGILKTGGSVQLSGDSFAKVNKGVLFFCNKEENFEDWYIKLNNLNDTVKTPYKNFKLKLIEIKDSQIVNKDLLANCVDCDRITGTVVFRSRCDGDEFRQNGRGVTKTLKKLFNEQKISVYERNKIAILADDEGILWIDGFGVSERGAISKESKNIVLICGEN